jgi:hypothetical protein
MRKACILIFCLLSVTYVYGQVVTFQSKPGSASGLDAYLSSFCKYPKNPDNLKVEKKSLTLNCQYEKKPVYRNPNHRNAQGA